MERTFRVRNEEWTHTVADHWFHLENAFCYADLGYARDIVHPACITKALSMG